jgi:HEAT repeat protein
VLCEIGPDAEAAVPALAKLLQNEERLDVRREAILALAAIGPAAAPAVPELTAALDCVEGINTGVAAFALGSIGPDAKAAEAKLKELAEAEDAPVLRQTVCLWALAKMNPDDEAMQQAAIPKLIDALKAPEQMVREAAARALIDLDPDPEFTRPLMQDLMAEASPEVLNEILLALASLGEKAVPRLIEVLKVPEARARAAGVIARIGPVAAPTVPGLIDALGDENPRTRSEILLALAAIGPDAKEAVPAITKALADPEPKVGYAACFALGSIGPDAIAAKADLQKNLAAEDQFLAMTSAWALAQIDAGCDETCKSSVPVLIKALDEPDADTRVHAARALGKLGPRAKDAVEALKELQEDENEQIREATAAAIKAIEG